MNSASHQTELDIAQVCTETKNMLIEKNRSYGDSALNPARIFSKADNVEQIKVRIDDKLSRLQQGNGNHFQEDVELDLIGYLILLRIAKKRQAQQDQCKLDLSGIAVQ